MDKSKKKSYMVRQGRGEWIVYHWDAQRGIYAGGQVVSYETARHAVACTNRDEGY